MRDSWYKYSNSEKEERKNTAEWVRQNLCACQNPMGKRQASRKATTGRREGERKNYETKTQETVGKQQAKSNKKRLTQGTRDGRWKPFLRLGEVKYPEPETWRTTMRHRLTVHSCDEEMRLAGCDYPHGG